MLYLTLMHFFEGEIILPEVIKALVLGIIQGLTEFIPVSSSAHLALTPWYLGWLEPTATYQLFFDLVLHWGTLLAVTVVFWRDFIALIVAWFQSIGRRSMADPNARLAWFIIVGTIPAVVVGYFFKDQIEALFHPAGDYRQCDCPLGGLLHVGHCRVAGRQRSAGQAPAAGS